MEAFATSFREMVNERRLKSIEESKSMENYPFSLLLYHSRLAQQRENGQILYLG